MSHPPQRLCVLADPYLMANEAQTLQRAVEQTGIEVPPQVFAGASGECRIVRFFVSQLV